MEERRKDSTVCEPEGPGGPRLMKVGGVEAGGPGRIAVQGEGLAMAMVPACWRWTWCKQVASGDAVRARRGGSCSLCRPAGMRT